MATGIEEFDSLDDYEEYYRGDPNLDGSYRVDPDPSSLPSKLTLKGTSTSNPLKPRTVAAGYDPKTMTMTVVFWDGTWWNYYDVPDDIWAGFEQADSKGAYLQESGLNTWDSMGPADMAALRPNQRAMLNWVARQSAMLQQASGGKQGYGDPRGSQFTR
jgi:hypothetical protein